MLEPEQRASSSILVDLEDFIEDLKLEAMVYDRRALKDVKKKLSVGQVLQIASYLEVKRR